jgi:hypothetical protein
LLKIERYAVYCGQNCSIPGKACCILWTELFNSWKEKLYIVGRTVLSNIQNIQVLNFDSLIAEKILVALFQLVSIRGKFVKRPTYATALYILALTLVLKLSHYQ